MISQVSRSSLLIKGKPGPPRAGRQAGLTVISPPVWGLGLISSLHPTIYYSGPHTSTPVTPVHNEPTLIRRKTGD